jgi:hypothetical protein
MAIGLWESADESPKPVAPIHVRDDLLNRATTVIFAHPERIQLESRQTRSVSRVPEGRPPISSANNSVRSTLTPSAECPHPRKTGDAIAPFRFTKTSEFPDSRGITFMRSSWATRVMNSFHPLILSLWVSLPCPILHGYLALPAEKRVSRDARKCRKTTART